MLEWLRMETVARYARPEEASLAKTHLEGNGIRAFVAEEHSMNTDWISAGGFGGIRLQVYPEDVDAAREVLDLPPDEGLLDEEEEQRSRSDGKVACPVCGSVDWEVARPTGLERLQWLWSALVDPSWSEPLRCLVCKRRFRATEKGVDGR